MAEEPENHTIRLLQEMRSELSDMRSEVSGMRGEFNDLRREMRSGFADVNRRIDGVTHLLTLLAGVSHDHEERITTLERDR